MDRKIYIFLFYDVEMLGKWELTQVFYFSRKNKGFLYPFHALPSIVIFYCLWENTASENERKILIFRNVNLRNGSPLILVPA